MSKVAVEKKWETELKANGHLAPELDLTAHREQIKQSFDDEIVTTLTSSHTIAAQRSSQSLQDSGVKRLPPMMTGRSFGNGA